MATLTQENRFLKINTPLGPDKLLLTSFSGSEEISRLFRFQLEMVSEDSAIEPKAVVGKNVTVSVLQSDETTERYFNGFISRFTQLPSELRLARYQAEMVPWFWFLTLHTDCRIFQEKTVLDIVEEVFKGIGFSDYEVGGIQGTHDPWEYCVQYRETDFNFVSRLLEQEGIFYYFRHEKGKHVMVLADQKAAHKPCPFQSTVRVEPGTGPGAHRDEDVVHYWEHQYAYRSGKWAQTDYNFETPSTSLMTNAQSIVDLAKNKKYEVYDYPGEYKTKSQGDVLTDLRMEEEEVAYDTVQGESDCRSFTTGAKFTLTDHEKDSENTSYVLTSITHQAQQGGFLSEDQTELTGYNNSFTCIPATVTFRPTRETPKPLVQGTQTAVVVGPKGEEIYSDKYGRVKVQFHWDRLGKSDENSSCWIRVSQPWAGKNWGAVWIPRIGQEVIIDCLEGDPDRPIIVGRVYNAEQMPPYDLPGNQTQSGFKSRSSKEGGSHNFNEIRFEDKKGSEEVYIHAEKDLKTVIENNETRTVGANRSTTIQKNETLVIKEGDRSESLEKGNDSLDVQTGNRDAKIQKGNDSLDVSQGNVSQQCPAGTYSIKGLNVKIEGTASIQLTCGGSKIDMNPGMITIQAPLVKIN